MTPAHQILHDISWTVKLKQQNKIEQLISSKLDRQQLVYTTPFLKKLIYLLEEHYSQFNFNVARLADLLCICPMQLYRKVSKETGMTPGHLLLRFRLNKALELLFNSENTITEISYDTGFGSPAHFSKAFKRVTGFTPTDIRKHYLNNVIKRQKEVINQK